MSKIETQTLNTEPRILTVHCMAKTDYTSGSWTPNRYWPLGQTVVELIDSDEDDDTDKSRIGRRTYACLMANTSIDTFKSNVQNMPPIIVAPRFVVVDGGQKPLPVVSEADERLQLKAKVEQLQLALDRVLNQHADVKSDGAGNRQERASKKE